MTRRRIVHDPARTRQTLCPWRKDNRTYRSTLLLRQRIQTDFYGGKKAIWADTQRCFYPIPLATSSAATSPEGPRRLNSIACSSRRLRASMPGCNLLRNHNLPGGELL